MTQITTRLSPELRRDFEDYAAGLGLDASELARLLIIRELKRRRILKNLKYRHLSLLDGSNRIKLTAHFHGSEPIKKFDQHAKTAGLSRASAARVLYARELEERWLVKAITR